MVTFIQQLALMADAKHASGQSNGASLPKRLVPEHIENLKAYQPGRPAKNLTEELGISELTLLASNENPMGPPPSALEAMKEVMSGLNRYPDAGGFILREALADTYRVGVENVVIGNGSESIMANIIRAFLCGDDEVVTSEGTFIGIYVLVNSQGVKLKTVPLKNYHFDLDGIADAITEKTKLVYLCNPNNPTGSIFSREEFETFMQKIPEHVLVILDEAYFEYAMGLAEFPDSMTYRYDNVITLRTFSKIYGMAGVRLGYGLGHDYLISFVNKVKLPFEPNTLAQAAGAAALRDIDYVQQALSNNEVGKQIATEEFDRLGIPYVETHANFIMVPYERADKVARLHERLLRQGVAIRPLHAFGLPDCFRVTIGLPHEMEKFVKALRNVV